MCQDWDASGVRDLKVTGNQWTPTYRKRGENGVLVWIEEELVEKHEVKNKEKCGKNILNI